MTHSETHHNVKNTEKSNTVAFWLSFGIVGILFVLVISLFVMMLLSNNK